MQLHSDRLIDLTKPMMRIAISQSERSSKLRCALSQQRQMVSAETPDHACNTASIAVRTSGLYNRAFLSSSRGGTTSG